VLVVMREKGHSHLLLQLVMVRLITFLVLMMRVTRARCAVDAALPLLELARRDLGSVPLAAHPPVARTVRWTEAHRVLVDGIVDGALVGRRAISVGHFVGVAAERVVAGVALGCEGILS